MKLKKLLYAPLLLVVLNSCKTHREVQKNSSHVETNAESSKETAKGTATLQQNKINRLDSSHAIGKNTYQRQTVNYHFTPDTNGSKAKGLENRLTGITVTTEQGTQALQTDNFTRQNTDLLNMASDSIKSLEKKSSSRNSTEAAKHTDTTRKVGGFWWWLIIIIILIVLIIIWKGNPIVLLIRRIRKFLKDGMPNSPA